MNHYRKTACLTASLLLFFLLSACTSGAAGKASPQIADALLPAKNIDQWVMPLDGFAISRNLDVKSVYADALLVQPCMDAQGFTRTVPRPDLSENERLRKTFDVASAEKYGYHPASVVDPPSGPWLAYVSRVLTPNEQEVFDNCDSKVSKRTTPPVAEINFTFGLANAAFNAAINDPKVVDASKEWRQCMLPRGLVDLPDVPGKMPTPSVAKGFGLATARQVGASLVSGAEKALATADAKCRDSSGYNRALYEAEWAAQKIALVKNAARLKQIRSELEKFDDTLDRIVSRNAPKS